MLKEKLKELYNRVNDDLDKHLQDIYFDLDKQQIIDNACEIYHAQNFYYHIEYIFDNYEDGDYEWITEKTIDKILNYNDNIVSYWVNHRYDIRHSERYNLESIEDFTNALDIVVGNMGE